MLKDHHPINLDKSCAWGYEIRVLGALDGRWAEWFPGIVLSKTQTGDRLPITVITCASSDQSRLRGVLNKIWDLNLCLISVTQTSDLDDGETE